MGYIKLYRKMSSWRWYDNMNILGIWIHLLLEANWEETTYRSISIPRGSLVTTTSKLAKETHLTDRQVRYALECLENGHEIVKKLSGRETIITICKYDDYQGVINTDCQGRVNEFVNENGNFTSPYIEEEYNNKKLINNNTPTFAGAYASTHVGEQGNETPPQAPSQDWRNLTSAFKATLGFDPDAIAEYKRKLISEELSIAAAAIGMPKEAQEMFLVKWCEHNPGSEKIKADYEPTFNTKDRATQFMSWWKKHEHRDRDKEREDRLNVNAKWGR